MYITIYTQDSLYLESVYFYISNIYSTRAILLLESFFFVIFFKFFSNFPAVACCCCCCWWCYYSSNNIGLPLPHFEFLLAKFLTHSIMLLFLLSRQMFHFQLLHTSCSFYFFFSFFFFFFFFLFSFFSSQQGLLPIIFHGNLFFLTFVLVPGFWLWIPPQPLRFFHQVLPIHFCLVFFQLLCLWLWLCLE